MAMVSCKNTSANFKKLPKSAYDTLIGACPLLLDKPVKLYYMNGECSFCFGKAMELSVNTKESIDTICILIAQTNNPMVTRVLMNDSKLTNCILYDSTNQWSGHFEVGHIYTISDHGEILASKSDQ